MRKFFSIVLSLFLILSTMTAMAEKFTIRKGITWYMSKEAVMDCLKAEESYDNYLIYDMDRNSIEEMYPADKNHEQVWITFVIGVTLGHNDENVFMLLAGTNKTGLTSITYMLYPKNAIEEFYYDRSQELLSQLEKKYGDFKIDDKWKKRNQMKVNEHVYQFWKTLDNSTLIYVHTTKAEKGYNLVIEYRCPKYDDIIQEMNDGSFYIETSFGL